MLDETLMQPQFIGATCFTGLSRQGALAKRCAWFLWLYPDAVHLGPPPKCGDIMQSAVDRLPSLVLLSSQTGEGQGRQRLLA